MKKSLGKITLKQKTHRKALTLKLSEEFVFSYVLYLTLQKLFLKFVQHY